MTQPSLPAGIAELPLHNLGPGHFDLNRELQRMFSAVGANLPEAAVLYGSRVLEKTAEAVIRGFELRVPTNLIDRLAVLRNGRLVEVPTHIAAEQIRRLGNDARHCTRTITDQDALIALVLVHRWIRWVLCDSPCAEARFRARAWTDDWSNLETSVTALLECVTGAQARSAVSQLEEILPANQSLRCLAMERLIDVQEFVLAAEQVQQSDRLPRLRELEGLLHSRQGQLEQAMDTLKPLLKRRFLSQELRGIVAGVYKRRWLTADGTASDLWQANAYYSEVWHDSERTEVYAGINAAATAAWLGGGDESRRTAAEVLEALDTYQNTRQRHGIDSAASFYDRVTRAEASLLVGALDAAGEQYRAAFSESVPAGQREAAQAQLAQHHRLLGVDIPNFANSAAAHQ